MVETCLYAVPRGEEGMWRWKGEDRKVVGTEQGSSRAMKMEMRLTGTGES